MINMNPYNICCKNVDKMDINQVSNRHKISQKYEAWLADGHYLCLIPVIIID